MDSSFGIDLDKVLDEFEQNEEFFISNPKSNDRQPLYGVKESVTFDLSEADFGPACFDSVTTIPPVFSNATTSFLVGVSAKADASAYTSSAASVSIPESIILNESVVQNSDSTDRSSFVHIAECSKDGADVPEPMSNGFHEKTDLILSPHTSKVLSDGVVEHESKMNNDNHIRTVESLVSTSTEITQFDSGDEETRCPNSDVAALSSIQASFNAEVSTNQDLATLSSDNHSQEDGITLTHWTGTTDNVQEACDSNDDVSMKSGGEACAFDSNSFMTAADGDPHDRRVPSETKLGDGRSNLNVESVSVKAEDGDNKQLNLSQLRDYSTLNQTDSDNVGMMPESAAQLPSLPTESSSDSSSDSEESVESGNFYISDDTGYLTNPSVPYFETLQSDMLTTVRGIIDKEEFDENACDKLNLNNETLVSPMDKDSAYKEDLINGSVVEKNVLPSCKYNCVESLNNDRSAFDTEPLQKDEICKEVDHVEPEIMKFQKKVLSVDTLEESLTNCNTVESSEEVVHQIDVISKSDKDCLVEDTLKHVDSVNQAVMTATQLNELPGSGLHDNESYSSSVSLTTHISTDDYETLADSSLDVSTNDKQSEQLSVIDKELSVGAFVDFVDKQIAEDFLEKDSGEIRKKMTGNVVTFGDDMSPGLKELADNSKEDLYFKDSHVPNKTTFVKENLKEEGSVGSESSETQNEDTPSRKDSSSDQHYSQFCIDSELLTELCSQISSTEPEFQATTPSEASAILSVCPKSPGTFSLDTAENFGECVLLDMTKSLSSDFTLTLDELSEAANFSVTEDSDFVSSSETIDEDLDDIVKSALNGLTEFNLINDDSFSNGAPRGAEARISVDGISYSSTNNGVENKLENGLSSDLKVISSGVTNKCETENNEDNIAAYPESVTPQSPSVCVDRVAGSSSVHSDNGARAQHSHAAQGMDPAVEENSSNVAYVASAASDLPVAPPSRIILPSGASATVGHPVTPVGELEAQASPALPSPPICANINMLITQLGKVAPTWLPDAEASECMQCGIAFSFTKRRHHCRACGKIFCSACCNMKSTLQYTDNKEVRVCSKCYQDLIRAQCYERIHPMALTPPGASTRLDPNNPSEYCSTIPPPLQVASAETPPLTVMVPTGVLRKQGSVRGSTETKQVMFSDGIRPGGDLAELDGSGESSSRGPSSQRRSRRADRSAGQSSLGKTTSVSAAVTTKPIVNFIPSTANALPPIVNSTAAKDAASHDYASPEAAMELVRKSDPDSPVLFAINHNLTVQVTIVNMECCVNRTCWCFTSQGLCTVGQDEVIVLLECLSEESSVPLDVFLHLSLLYDEASKGNTVTHLGFTQLPHNSLGSTDPCGFIYTRQTFQCLQNIILPEPPFLFAILIHKSEIPWAKTFPLRLVLRLGAEFRYYPCPLIGVRGRKPVYGDIGHTIMNLLADFHNYQYTLPRVPSLLVHMEDRRTIVRIPPYSYEAVTKVLNSSDEHVLAFGASFSRLADSHLVCLQNDDATYQTQAINIQNRPRKVTGACFIVFNGALKSSSGMKAKLSIVEDGIMAQISNEAMAELKTALREMKDYMIQCGPVDQTTSDEMISVEWITSPMHINIGVKSPIDGLSLEDVESVRVHSATDYSSQRHVIRWTELFFIRNDLDSSDRSNVEPMNELRHLADSLAQACCLALSPHLEQLSFEMMTKIGLRVTLDTDQVGYEVGSRGTRLPDVCMNDLDEKLIPVIHGSSGRRSVVLELTLHVLRQGDRSTNS